LTIPDYFESRDLWVPAVLPRDGAERAHKYLSVLGRLKQGVSLRMAEEEMNAITERLVSDYSREMKGFGTKRQIADHSHQPTSAEP